MYQVILVTFPNKDEAITIAKVLIEEKLAACINILPAMLSVYKWEDKLKVDDEVQMIIKTKAEIFESLNDRITQLHSYEFPEVIALDINQGNSDYLNWIKESLS